MYEMSKDDCTRTKALQLATAVGKDLTGVTPKVRKEFNYAIHIRGYLEF